MATIKTFFPESNLKDFQKFVSKMQKHVDINISFGKPYSKTFTHASDNGFIKMQHQIVDMEIILPELNNWQLLASYKDGEAFIADMSKELVPSNPNHGADYRICDACKHAMRKEMYLVVNVNTGEELQVGAECAKKFGIQGLKWVSDFIKELYRVYEFNGSDISDEEPMWRGKLTDMHAVRSVSVSDAIKASKLYYDEKGGIWLKGGKVNGVYQTSESKAIISNYIDEKHFGCNDAYVEEVKAFIADIDAGWNEFKSDIKSNISNHYMGAMDLHFAFFAVKEYEDYKASRTLRAFEAGQQLHIIGQIIEHKMIEGYYGMFDRYVIKSQSGHTFIRDGKIPEIENANGELSTEFYALVKSVGSNKKVYLDRALKNAKKNIAVIEL